MTAQAADLIGHWPLTDDAKDVSASGNHGVNHGVVFDGESGAFSGRDSFVEIPDALSLALGKEPFSLSALVRTDAVLDDVLGDIVSKFDPVSRTGFTFTLKHNVGATNSQANYRHLEFGIDAGRLDPEWSDRGRPGEAVMIFSMAVFDENLYAGTCVAGEDQAGRVFRYDGDADWIDCGAPDKSNAVSALAVWNGKLYAGTAKYRLKGSSLDESENTTPGGSVYRYEGGKKWTKVATLPDREGVNGLVVYRDALYATSMYAPAGFFRYDADGKWEDCGVPGGKRVEQMCVFNGELFATCYDGGFVFRYDGDKWTDCGQLGDNTQTYAFCVHEGKLFCGTWPSGKVYRYDADNDWFDAGRLGGEKEVMGMALYNGKMYGGTLPLGEVYRYDGGTRWENLGEVDSTPDVRYRRAWTMATYRGELFVGTLPSGKVMSRRAGEVVAMDRAFPAGWVYVTAVRSATELSLFVDGELVATREIPDSVEYEIDNAEPLKIGFGPHDFFNGSIKDVRLYRGELSLEEIGKLK